MTKDTKGCILVVRRIEDEKVDYLYVGFCDSSHSHRVALGFRPSELQDDRILYEELGNDLLAGEVILADNTIYDLDPVMGFGSFFLCKILTINP